MPDDQIIEGEIEEGKIYTEPDFNKIIEIEERETKRVKIFLSRLTSRRRRLYSVPLRTMQQR